jgi:hypothetical protein
MKKIASVIFTIIVFLSGFQSIPVNKTSEILNPINPMNKPFCDEVPIVMHGHVKNTSGGGISGASIKLRIPGTTTVLYSATADGNGDYEIDSIVTGTYGIRVAATGYVTKTFDLSITSNFTRTDTLVAQ